jgi:hypothetical protein
MLAVKVPAPKTVRDVRMNRAMPQEGLSGTFSPVKRQVQPVQAHRCTWKDTAGTSKQLAAMGLAAAPSSNPVPWRTARSDGPIHTPLPTAVALNILMHLPVSARPHCFQGKHA